MADKKNIFAEMAKRNAAGDDLGVKPQPVATQLADVHPEDEKRADSTAENEKSAQDAARQDSEKHDKSDKPKKSKKKAKKSPLENIVVGDPDQVHRVGLDLPEIVHKALKLRATTQPVKNMSEWAAELLAESLSGEIAYLENIAK